MAHFTFVLHKSLDTCGYFKLCFVDCQLVFPLRVKSWRGWQSFHIVYIIHVCVYMFSSLLLLLLPEKTRLKVVFDKDWRTRTMKGNCATNKPASLPSILHSKDQRRQHSVSRYTTCKTLATNGMEVAGQLPVAQKRWYCRTPKWQSVEWSATPKWG